jgi:hypothetical protein
VSGRGRRHHQQEAGGEREEGGPLHRELHMTAIDAAKSKSKVIGLHWLEAPALHELERPAFHRPVPR